MQSEQAQSVRHDGQQKSSQATKQLNGIGKSELEFLPERKSEKASKQDEKAQTKVKL
jgi:hypothetical protein